MPTFLSLEQAATLIPDGATIMVGGFLGCGSPHKLLDALQQQGARNLTIICNDGGTPSGPNGGYYGIAGLLHNGQVKKLIATHVGKNPEVAQLVNENALELTLVPMGSFVEMIRAGGAGLGGVLTPTGIGTMVETFLHVHSIVNVDGRDYLLERPLRADFSLISGYKVDRAGNIWYRGAARNFNPVMATAAEVVIAEADHIVEIGGIEPENIVTSGVYIDYVTGGENHGTIQ